MIDNIIKKYFNSTVYIRFTSRNIQIRLVEKKREIEDIPVIAVKNHRKNKKLVAGVGKGAEVARLESPDSITIYNAFEHPRTFVCNFELAEATLRHFITQVFQRRTFIRPIMILHPLEKTEGGVTQIEHRGLIELATSAGARESYVWVGRKLSDDELVNLKFPENEGTLGWG